MQQMAWNVSVSPLIFFIISQLIKKLLLSTILSVCSSKSARWLWSSWHNPCRPFWNEKVAWPISPLLRTEPMGYVLLHWVQKVGSTRCILYAQNLFSAVFNQLRLCRSKNLTHIDFFFTFLWLLNHSWGSNPLPLFLEFNSSKTLYLHAAHLLCVELEYVEFLHNPGGGY